jgi:hypothetical protein
MIRKYGDTLHAVVDLLATAKGFCWVIGVFPGFRIADRKW